ncbi:glyoxal oxidase, partial [Serendipita vermifera MAFF 305830]
MLALALSLFPVVYSTPLVNSEPRLNARADTLPQPGQPTTVDASLIGGFAVVGTSGVSAQQLFLGDAYHVYILDKVESNPLPINDHSAWATVYDLRTNIATPLDVRTNTFCAGGGLLADGRWLNIGGNKAVEPGAVTNDDPASQAGQNPYSDVDGRNTARFITPGDGAQWQNDPTLDMTTQRWYPSVETLEDGRMLVMGGSKDGAFVNNLGINNPTYEIWPPAAGESVVDSPLLAGTLPANQYPITHLLPSGEILINVNHNASLLNYQTGGETTLPAVPHAVRTYPASASSAMLPLSPANNYSATVMYCGGIDLQDGDWLAAGKSLIDIEADKSCVKISPQQSHDWEEEDYLPEGRVMGNAILLPDGTILVVNGANKGVAGYADATQPWNRDDSLADSPLFTPVIFDPSRPAGQRWSRDGLKSSTVARMYHSSATLLPDGSVFISGSNPHADYSPDKTFPTEYAVEIFYPPYYNKRRPEPAGIPTTISYGGASFDLYLSKDDLNSDATNTVKKIKIVLARTGFSTHALNFGMRNVELDYTYQLQTD